MYCDYTLGLGERKNFAHASLALIYLEVKFNFKNILLNNFFDPRPF
jgi:hypothetical protein